MERVITIDDKSVRFKATASTVRRYRNMFGADLLLDMNDLLTAQKEGKVSGKNLDTFLNLAYIMAKQADDSIPADPEDWLDEFDVFPINDVLPQIVALWQDSNITTVAPKNV